jgi:hypothetical protein
MIFPISVKFNSKLKTTITPDNKQQILLFIQKSILEDNANNVVFEDMSVGYKGTTSRWRGALFGSVDNGIFNLLYKDSNWFLIYQINMRKLFIAAAIMSTVMAIFGFKTGDSLWIGIGFFSWFCGGNWIINIIRHGSVASDIAFSIDELFADKDLIAESDEDKERLKSWY